MFTDIFLYFLFVILLIRGALRGFLASIFDPLSVILASLIAYIYYAFTHNILITLLISLLGPFLINFIFKNILQFFKNADEKHKPNFISRISGALITLVWGSSFIILLIFFLTFMPPILPLTQPILRDIKSSVIISFISKPLKILFFPETQNETKEKNETKNSGLNLPKVNINPEAFINDPKIQTLVNDPDVKAAIESKNYTALITNPKVMQLAQDPLFIKKIMKEMMKQESKTKTEE